MPSPNPQFSRFLERLAESLYIPDDRAKQARKRYKAVGDWLNRDGSSVASFSPDIYSQGSFRLGTVIKPQSDGEEYDIDLVSTLSLRKSQLSQSRLKEMIGREIKAYAKANNMNAEPDEGQRCWTLVYADGAQFHMDILPAIPDAEGYRLFLESRSTSAEWTEHAIAITDTDLPNYTTISEDWPRSNPKGYAEWFKSRMEVRFLEARKMAAESIQASIEDIPIYDVKTPLQQVIQILKRHRDTSFQGEPDDKPISIIITTLAAHAYNNEADVLEALINIVNGMKGHIEKRYDEQSGKLIDWIGNPVNPVENFADKWPSNPIRKQHFYNWLNAVQVDLRNALETGDVHAFGDSLRKHIGDRYINEALSGFGDKTNEAFPTLESETKSLGGFDVPHRTPPKWPVQIQGAVKVTATYLKHGWRPMKFRSGESLTKGYSLHFMASTNIARPYTVYWQVVNTGKEADDRNCLRGGFYDEKWKEGKRYRKESTMYQGQHWVECFVVKNGMVVARSGEFVVSIL